MKTYQRVLLFFVLPIIAVLSYPPRFYQDGLKSSPTTLIGMLVIVVALFIGLGFLLQSGRSQALTFGIFVQGFNVIIRIMMFFPNAAKSVGDSIIVNWLYIFFSLLGLGISMFLMLRLDRSDVRVTMTK
ncbi:MAG TPA: hypothetical protein PKM21_04665 [Anaerolineales bacterium]|nr:hypothetical protein [Anaerolineales bacterium]